jgi:hypothetical protein
MSASAEPEIRDYHWFTIVARDGLHPSTFYAWDRHHRDRMIERLNSDGSVRSAEPGPSGFTTLRRGQRVTVNAYGRDRRGQVRRLGPRRVVVTFERNAAGALATRPFAAWEVHPG